MQPSPPQPTTISIFDPPMCCPTGLCGPAVDPALLDIQEALLRVQAAAGGRIKVERFVLGQQAQEFMRRGAVVSRLQARGVGVLPITMIGDRIVKEGEYPTLAELGQWTGLGEPLAAALAGGAS